MSSNTQAALLHRYMWEGGMNEVEGWFWGNQVHLFHHINSSPDMQKVEGDLGEIGVHHGRLFILLMLLRRAGEKAVAMDVFDMQEFNTDGSGAGSLEILKANIDKHAGGQEGVEFIRADSMQLRPEDVLKRTGGRRFRMLSVDASHTTHHTANDLRLAHDLLAPGGIIVVDDMFNSGFPMVAEGVARFMLQSPVVNIVPVVAGENKVVFTTRSHHARYLEHYRTAPFDKFHVVREYYGAPCICF